MRKNGLFARKFALKWVYKYCKISYMAKERSETMKKFIIGALCAVTLLINAGAANVKVDGESFSGARLIDSVTYVPIRAFGNVMSDCEVVWDDDSKTASLSFEGRSLSAGIGEKYLESGGRYVYSGNENKIIDGSTYVPLRSIAKIFGAEISWDSESKTALVGRGGEVFASADEVYDANDLYWLSKIISAESAGEPLEGKIAVGNVVMNRVRNEDYPESVYGVIFDEKGGVQFTPVANGTIYNEPTEESVMAAKICLEDYKLSADNILFFLNPQISTSTWIPDNRDFVMTIGRHDFYA